MNDREKLVAEFIRDQSLAVVSSLWEGNPQSAVVVFSVKDDFELIFATFSTTRKYRNLLANSNTSIVIGWDTGVTVQYEGRAIEVEADKLKEYQEIHLKKNPGSEKYAHLDYQRYFRVVPNWIRYTDINEEPEFVFELSFNDHI